MIDAGRKIFHGKGTCHACHGDKLQGGPVAPALTGSSWRHITGTFDVIVDRVDNGLPGTLHGASPGRYHGIAGLPGRELHLRRKPPPDEALTSDPRARPSGGPMNATRAAAAGPIAHGGHDRTASDRAVGWPAQDRDRAGAQHVAWACLGLLADRTGHWLGDPLRGRDAAGPH